MEMKIKFLDKKIKYTVFDDGINIFWDKIFNLEKELVFDIYIDNKFSGNTKYTHFEFYDLQSKTEYVISVIAKFKDTNEIFYEYEEIKVLTKSKKTAIYVNLINYVDNVTGLKENTTNIQKALDNCKRNQRVIIPKGVFLCGALNMPSNTELYIEAGGVLLGSSNYQSYLPKRASRFEGHDLNRYSALINVGTYDNSGKINAENIIIRGKGEIRGGGLELANNVINYELEQSKDKIELCDAVKSIAWRLRPFLIDINNCKNVIISGLKVGHGSSWNIHFVYSKNIVINKCEIKSNDVRNGDGIDPDSSENIVIYDVKLDTGDDGIAIKSGKNPEGNIINIPCKNIKIFDVEAWQGIAVGSELSGGIKDVFMWDIVIHNSSRGMRIKTTAERGGYVKNYYISNVVCPYIEVTTKYACNNDGKASGEYTKIENLYFENITITCQAGEYEFASGFKIGGFDDENSIKNVVVKNLILIPKNKKGNGTISLKYIKNLQFDTDLLTKI